MDNMITEDYVSFETAKLLKEKGFDWEESPFYCVQDRDKWRQENNYTVPNPHYDSELPFDTETLTLIAPHVSLQMAMKWLREICNIKVNIWYSNPNYATEYFEPNTQTGVGKFILIGEDYPTYEQACEAAIRHCLQNLI